MRIAESLLPETQLMHVVLQLAAAQAMSRLCMAPVYGSGCGSLAVQWQHVCAYCREQTTSLSSRAQISLQFKHSSQLIALLTSLLVPCQTVSSELQAIVVPLNMVHDEGIKMVKH